MTGPTTEVDVLVVGGGIAGVSVAAAIALRRRVLLVEQEAQLAQHATGRSAASWVATLGPAPIRALTRASRVAFDSMVTGGAPVLATRPKLWLATDEDARRRLDDLCREVAGLERLDARGVRRRHDAIRGHGIEGAVEEGACDIDVLAVHQHHVRAARAAGAEIWREARVIGADPAVDGRFRVTTTAGTVAAEVVVNAAGAWADQVAEAFDATPAGLQPLRRTIAIARPSRPVDPDWPFTADLGEGFYFKPEGPNVLVSPADQTPHEPGDARPDELDVARALDAVNAVTDLGLRSVQSSWAGLRTFAPDGLPIVGFDPTVPGLFWFAGQGGYGIQIAPAFAALAAALLDGEPVPDGIAAEGFDVAAVRPGR